MMFSNSIHLPANDNISKNPTLKWGKDLNRQFSKEDIQTYSSTINLQEVELKITIRYQYISTRMAINKRQTTSVGKNRKKLKHPYTADGNTEYCSSFGKQSGISFNS
jgi:hypothetical protein